MRTTAPTRRFERTFELPEKPELVTRKAKVKAPLVESVIIVVEVLHAIESPVDPMIVETQVPKVESNPSIARKAILLERVSRRLVTDLVNNNEKATGLVDTLTTFPQRVAEIALVPQVVLLARILLKGANGVGA